MRLKNILTYLQDYYFMSFKALILIPRPPLYLKDTLEQMEYSGWGSLFIICLVSLFIGMALSLQISAELASLGLKMYTGKIVGMAVVREIGPVAVALTYAGRVGSGMTSEIGSMVLGHQVDILRVFGVDPIKKLVVPRLLSSLVMLPALTVIGDAVSIAGGYYIAVFVSHQSGSFYMSSIKDVLNFENIFSGITKPFIFGFIISTISCFMGLQTTGGARGLRRATTTAVVLSIVMIIISDFLLTRVLLFALGMRV